MRTRREVLQLAGAGIALETRPLVGLIFAASSRPVPPGDGVRFITEGIGLGHTLPEEFDQLAGRVTPVARKLARAGARSIVLMSPPISFYRGAAFNQRLSAQLASATGLASVTASTAIVDRLRTARARRVAVATVYTEEISLHLQGFLEESGFEVVTVKGLGIERFEESAPVTETVTGAEFMEFCVTLRESRPEADALLMASGYLDTAGLVEPLEKRCQIPVVNATAAALRAGVQLVAKQ